MEQQLDPSSLPLPPVFMAPAGGPALLLRVVGPELLVVLSPPSILLRSSRDFRASTRISRNTGGNIQSRMAVSTYRGEKKKKLNDMQRELKKI